MSDELNTGVNVEAIAEMCHQANRAYCQSIGDYSQPAWVDAPDWQKQSAMAGVQALIDNPDNTPEDMHNLWMEAKAADGWTYGDTKDPDAKTHPCMVPYADLPEDQRKKDDIFRETVLCMIFTDKPQGVITDEPASEQTAEPAADTSEEAISEAVVPSPYKTLCVERGTDESVTTTDAMVIDGTGCLVRVTRWQPHAAAQIAVAFVPHVVMVEETNPDGSAYIYLKS